MHYKSTTCTCVSLKQYAMLITALGVGGISHTVKEVPVNVVILIVVAIGNRGQGELQA